jgi:hypothetical protein
MRRETAARSANGKLYRFEPTGGLATQPAEQVAHPQSIWAGRQYYGADAAVCRSVGERIVRNAAILVCARHCYFSFL